MATFKNFEQARDRVIANGDLLSVTMEELRDAHGVRKLGVNVVARISEELSALGLKHFPADLPLSQWEQVRLYRAGSALGRVIELLESFGDEQDAELSDLVMGDAQETLKAVRKLVCL